MHRPLDFSFAARNSVALRSLETDDAEDIYVACQDAEIIKWTTVPNPYSREDARWFINNAGPHTWAILLPEFGNRWCGTLELRLPSDGEGSPSLGYFLAPWARGHGAMTSAVLLIKDRVFASGFDRLSIALYPGNSKSQAVACRAGFTFQETIKNGGIQRGQPRDLEVYVANRLPQGSSASQDEEHLR